MQTPHLDHNPATAYTFVESHRSQWGCVQGQGFALMYPTSEMGCMVPKLSQLKA